MTRHSGGNLSLGPGKEFLSLWGPFSRSQKPRDWGGRKDQIQLQTRKLKTEGMEFAKGTQLEGGRRSWKQASKWAPPAPGHM